MQFFNKISEIYKNETERALIWLIFLFAAGSYFFIEFFEKVNSVDFAVSLILFSLSLICAKNNKKNLLFSAFIFGFIISYLNLKVINGYNEISGKVFVDVTGEISSLSYFKNKSGASIVLSDLTLKKSKFSKKKKAKKKKRKISKSYIQKNFMNMDSYTELDYEFLLQKANYQNVKWQKSGDDLIYPRPPKKIRIFVRKNFPKSAEIGDIIEFKAILMPFEKPNFIGAFDFSEYNFLKNIGAQGYSISDIKIVKKGAGSIFGNYFKNLRLDIQKKISASLELRYSGIAKALLTGDRKDIDKDIMQKIRNSGLAHLIAISGLHLTLSAAIFFFLARFLLLQSSYLTLHYDIKKIAAIFAIIGSYFYLQIAGAPISAQRAFIMVLFAMFAILLDRKSDLLRIVFFAGFLIILINPLNMFLISFQLSFAAVLGIVAFHEIWSDFYDKKFNNLQQSGKIHNFFKYLFEMIFISFVAQVANMAFLIHHFGDVAIYGSLSNLIAIPLTSFLIMPLGFLSLFLMLFNLEYLALAPMSYLLEVIIQTAEFTSGLKGSHIDFSQISKAGLFLTAFGGILFVILKNKTLKFIAFIVFLSAFFFVKLQPKPNILIDGNASFFALYSDNKGLVFSKKVRSNKKKKLWLEEMDEKEFKILKNDKFSYCLKSYCVIDLKNYFQKGNKEISFEKMLVIKKRIEVNKICYGSYDIIVNLTKKYSLPSCANKAKILINNFDILKNGAHFIYFTKSYKYKISNLRDKK